MRFLRPEFLILFVLFVIPALIYLFFRLRNEFKTRKIWEESRLKEISRFSSQGKKILGYFLLVLAASLLIFASAGPQLFHEKLVPDKKPIDILCLVDNSWSMNTKDAKLNGKTVFRLDLAKEELRNFVKDHIGKEKNRMAFIAFGPNAVFRSYFTYGIGALLFHIDYFNVKDFSPESTDIGLAIDCAIDMLEKIDTQPDIFGISKNKRIFIIISDGADHGENLDEAVLEARQKRASIYTIGVGSINGGYIAEEVDERGNIIYMEEEAEDGTLKPIFSRLEEDTLKRIARLGGGTYVRSNTGKEFAEAFRKILESEARGTKKEKQYYDIYHYVLFVAFGCCLLIIILRKI